MGKRRRFTQKFKLEAVRLLEVGGRPAAEIARELGVPRKGRLDMRKKRFQRGSLQKRKHSRRWVWVALWRDPSGSRRYRTLGRCSQMSHAEASRELQAILEPLNGLDAPSQDAPQTFQGFVESDFLPFYRKKWKGSTAITSSNRIERHLVAEFGEKPLADFARDELQAFLDKKAADGLSFSVVDHLRWDLRSIFEMAFNDGHVSRKPARDLYTPRESRGPVRRSMNEMEVPKCLSVLDLRESLIVRLAVFAVERNDGRTWSDLLTEWNSSQEDGWKYPSHRNLARDARDTHLRLMGYPFDWKGRRSTTNRAKGSDDDGEA